MEFKDQIHFKPSFAYLLPGKSIMGRSKYVTLEILLLINKWENMSSFLQKEHFSCLLPSLKDNVLKI